MSEETKVATETVSEGTTPQTSTETPDVGSLIAESKKYRQRSQDAEAQLAKLQAKLEQQENAKLKEKEAFKELAEKFESQVNELTPFKDKYETILANRKEKLLSQIPKEQRETFKDKDIDVLEFMVENMSINSSPEVSARGSIKPSSPKKDWTKMSAEEKRANWTDILKSYKNS
jgi:formyltetrahydrofolate hydrolase